MDRKNENKGTEGGAPQLVSIDDVRSAMGEARTEIKGLLDQRAQADEVKMRELDTKLSAAVDKYGELEAKMGDLSESLKEFELARKRGSLGLGAGGEAKSIGALFVESDEFKSYQGNKGAKKSDAVHIGPALGQKDYAVLSLDAGSGGALTEPFLIRDPFPIRRRMPRVRDFIPRNPLATDGLEWIEQTNWNFLYGEVRAATGTGAVTVSLKTPRSTAAHAGDGSEFGGVAGFYDGQEVTFAAGTLAEETVTISNLDPAAGTFDCTLANNHAAGVAVTADDYQFTAETTLKPRARATYERKSEQGKTLATSIPISNQMARDASQLRQMIDAQMLESLKLTEERQILYGDGSSDQLLGFFNHPNVQSYKWSDGVTNDTKIDCLRRAMTLADLAHFPVEAIMVHPTDWEEIELQKEDAGGTANTGMYMLPNVPGGNAQRTLFGVPVIVTTALQPGDALLGAFSVGSAIWDREDATIRLAEQHEDFFARNMQLMLAEESMVLAIYYPESFVKVDFDSKP